MSVREFLIDYADAAQSSTRLDLSRSVIRFGKESLCPLELPSGGEFRFREAASFYGLDGVTEDHIVGAADYRWRGVLPLHEKRVWRAVLEKLAEPAEPI